MTRLREQMESYLFTFIRFAATAITVVGLMVGLNVVLKKFGVKAETANGYALILPWLLGFIIFTAFPILYSLFLSFTDYDVIQAPEWVGFRNYERIFTRDIDFGPSIRLTLLYAFLSVPIGIVGSLLIALLMSNDLQGIGAYRTVYYLPTVLPEVAIALLWRWIFNPDVGLLNTILRPVLIALNVPPPDWFGDPQWVLPAFVIISLWGITGVNMVIFLAALKNVPRFLYESAIMDGAKPIRRFFSITLPMITPVIFLQAVRGLIAAMQVFTMYAFTRATPRAGKFMNFVIYQNGFQQFRMGYASAYAWILFVIILVLTLLIFRSSEMWVYYEGKKK